MITLTPQEREKFIAWLTQEAESQKALAEQAAKLPDVVLIAKKMKIEAGMLAWTAAWMSSWETYSIGDSEVVKP